MTTPSTDAPRSYDRGAGALRAVQIESGFVRTADGSALSVGEPRVAQETAITAGAA